MTRRPPSLEELLAAVAPVPRDIEMRRARSWAKVARVLREPVRSSRWPFVGAVLGLGTAVAAAVFAYVLVQPDRALVAAVHGVVTADVGPRTIFLHAGDRLPVGTRIETSATGWVALSIGDDRVSIDTDSVVTLREMSRLPSARVVIDQTRGRTWHVPAHRPDREYVVRTDAGSAIARGTAFLVESIAGEAPRVVTVEGVVQVDAPAGSALVPAGQQATLTAAPPAVEPAPTVAVETTTPAALVDPLGRTCGADSRELPGCVPSATGFVVVPSAAREVRLRVEAAAPTTIDVVVAGQRAQVAVPAAGTFQVKVELSTVGTRVRADVKLEAERVEPAAEPEVERNKPAATPVPRTPPPTSFSSATPTTAPERSRTPEPTRTAEVRGTPEATRTPNTTRTAEPSRTPEPTRTAEPSRTPELRTPEPTRTPEPSSTPEPTRTPEPTGTAEPTRTPDATRTPEPTRSPEPTRTPEATPVPTPTPGATSTPGPTPTAQQTSNPAPTRTPEPTATPEPTRTASPTPTPTPTPEPTHTPEPTRTASPPPTPTPTRTP